MQRIAMLAYHTCPATFQEGGEVGGLNIFVWELSHALGDAGLKVDIFTRSHHDTQPQQRELHPNIRLIHLPAGPAVPLTMDEMLTYLDEYIIEFERYCQNNKLQYDLFHCHYYLSGLIALRYVQKSCQYVPIIMSFHTLGLAKNQNFMDSNESGLTYRVQIETELANQSQHIIANSSLDRQHLHELYQVPYEKISVLAPGVNPAIFSHKHPREHKTTFELLFVGRPQRIKGLQQLLCAFKLLEQVQPERFNLTIITSNQDIIMQSAIASNLLKMPRIVSQSTPEMLAKSYHAADALILPSFYESFGMVALEAMACGIAALVTRECGIHTLIEQHHPEWVMQNNTPECIVDTILYASRNPELLSPNVDMKPYEWPHIAEKIKSIFANTI